MPTKPLPRKWTDVHIAITALAVTITISMWNLFSSPDKSQANAQVVDTSTPPPPNPAETVENPTAVPPSLAFVPVKVIYGGVMPTQEIQASATPAPTLQVQYVQAPANLPKKPHNGGGGGGGGSSPAPKTGSSHP